MSIAVKPINSSSGYYVDKIPNDCPFCHHVIQPELKLSIKTDTSLQVVFQCSNHKCLLCFVGSYSLGGTYGTFDKINNGVMRRKIFDEAIKEVSANFEVIYNEAYQAEQYQLHQICGVGYRKALEFLVKDYCIAKQLDSEEEVKTKLLGKVINDHIDNGKIKAMAKRATWLGNDETHYVRKWESKSLNDLKNLIDAVVYFILMDHLYEINLNEMPD